MQFELFDEDLFEYTGRSGGDSYAHQILAYCEHPRFYGKNQPAILDARRAEWAVVYARLDELFAPFCRRTVAVRRWMGVIGNDYPFKPLGTGQVAGSRIGQHELQRNLFDAVGFRTDIVRHMER